MSGISMACRTVAGAVALLLQRVIFQHRSNNNYKKEATQLTQ